MDVQLRPIETNDAAFLHSLMNHPALMERLHQPPTNLTDWQEAIQLWHSDPDEEGYIITTGSEPVGWFAVNGLCSDLPYIKMAVLLPEYQVQGIGRRMIDQLCGQLHSQGYSAVRLFTDQDNLRAQRCYQRSGFRIIDTLEEPWPDGSILLRCEMEKVF